MAVTPEERAKYAKRRYGIAKKWEGERKMEEQRREVAKQKKQRAAAKPKAKKKAAPREKAAAFKHRTKVQRIGRPVGRGARLRPKATLRSRSARRATTTHKPKPENRRSIWPGTTGGAQRIRPSKPPPKRVGPARTRAGTTSRRTTRSRR